MHSRALLAALLAFTACAPAAERSSDATVDTLIVSEAASLARPMRAVLDSFARSGTVPKVLQVEHGGSLELARRVTETGRVPDILLLADQEVFPELLMPGVTSWYMRFARNRMTIAYTDRSRHASDITAQNWRHVLQRDDVLLGRPDPAIAPAGYRALLVFRLAESFYQEPGLAARLAARTPPSRTRGNAAELAALLEAGELDYILEYESVARAHRLRFLTLPAEIDLGDPTRAGDYG
nr:substrate-binding domain-containing protein [Gemmatimonadaceae bacterium]